MKKALKSWETVLLCILVLEFIIFATANSKFLMPRVLFGSINDMISICIISLFVVNNVWGYLLAALFLALCIRLSNVPFKFMVKGMKSIVFLMLFAVVFKIT